MGFSNVYEDDERAAAYSKLEFLGTYYLAFRDLPTIITEHVMGKRALDFGCGAGRSSRFLENLGFHTIGIDISEEMISRAKEINSKGDYRLVKEGDFSELEEGSFDLILSAFPFDNIPTMEQKVMNLTGLGNLLSDDGKLVNLVSTPEMYTHEWASFSTKDYTENIEAKTGDAVRIVQLDTEDKRPVQDILWTHESYLETYSRAQLEIVDVYRPLGRDDEPHDWINETKIPPWVVYVLKRI